MRRLTAVQNPLRGRIRVPGDRAISHLVALLAPLSGGPCRAEGWLRSDETRHSLQAVHDLGARSEVRQGTLTVWPGIFPEGANTGVPLAVDCGKSVTTARLLLGLLAGRRGDVLLTGDDALRRRPMAPVVESLRAMGARIDHLDREGALPVRIRGGALRGREHRLARASAGVKSALVLAGLAARGRTRVHGAEGSCDHTERLLACMGAPVLVADPGHGGDLAVEGPAGPLRAFDLVVPGDPSSAGFLLAAGALVPGSDLTVAGVLLNPTRTGFLDLLRAAGADLLVTPLGAAAWPDEPRGDVRVRFRPLPAFRLRADALPGSLDGLPVLAVLATQAEGETVVGGAAELRAGECDLIATVTRELIRLGARIEERPDGWRIHGPTPLRAHAHDDRYRGNHTGSAEPHVVVTEGDHRVAMAMAVAALIARGPLALDDAGCIAASLPGLLDEMAKLTGAS
ncbi:MAG: 3-phosphoshikimate 1-carboxyvinyltransferase [Candidatus Krumholzibacteriia bacterium]